MEIRYITIHLMYQRILSIIEDVFDKVETVL